MSTDKHFNLLRKRDFGDLMQDSIQFVIQNARVLIRALVIYIGPLFLISAIINTIYFRDSGLANLNMEELMADPAQALAALGGQNPDWAITGLSFLVGIATLVVLIILSNSVLLQYKNAPQGNIQMDSIWEDIKTFSLPYTGLTLLNILIFLAVYIGGVLVVVLAVSAVDNSALAVFLVFGLIGLIFYVATIQSLTYIIRMNEEVTSFQSVQRAFRLIKGHWWQTFGLLFVMSFVVLFIIFGLYGMAGAFALIFGEETINLGGMLVIGGLLGSLISSLFYTVIFTAIGFQYFNLHDEREQAFDASRIDEIGIEADEEENNQG